MKVDSPYAEWLFKLIYREGNFEQKIEEAQDWEILKPVLNKFFNNFLKIYRKKRKEFPDFNILKKTMLKKADKEINDLNDVKAGFSLSFCE